MLARYLVSLALAQVSFLRLSFWQSFSYLSLSHASLDGVFVGFVNTSRSHTPDVNLSTSSICLVLDLPKIDSPSNFQGYNVGTLGNKSNIPFQIPLGKKKI